MATEYPVVWESRDAQRFVGRLGVAADELTMDGTTTTPTREHRQIRIPHADIARATVERTGDGAAVRIESAGGEYLIELLAGGRGAALALAEELTL